jgi:hypothetical protein
VLTVVPGAADADDPRRSSGGASLIDELVRDGARRMLAEALQAEVDDYIARFVAERDENGRRLVVRNGSHQPREVVTSAGAVEVTAPRVNDRRSDPESGERRRFSSAILPAWCRKTPKVTEVLPLLYLHGLSTGDFVPALGQFLGSSAGLSAPVITKLTEAWRTEQRAFAARDLSGVDYVYLWVDGIHVNIRLDEHKLPAGHDRCPRRRPEGTRRARRRLPGVHRVVGGPAAGLRPAWDALPDPRHGRRCARVLGCATRGVPAGQRAAQLVPQDRQRSRRAAEVRASRGEEGPGRDLERRGPPARPRRRTGVRGRLRSALPQGHSEDHRRPRAAARVLRLPRRALDPPPHDQPHPPSPPSGTAPRSPAVPAPELPGSPWRSSSSRPPRTAGAR